MPANNRRKLKMMFGMTARRDAALFACGGQRPRPLLLLLQFTSTAQIDDIDAANRVACVTYDNLLLRCSKLTT